MYNKIITLSLYNREDYTFHVLNHLSKCNGIETYTIIPVIDHDNKSGRNQAEMTSLLYAATCQTKLKIDQPRYQQSNVGCNANIFTCLNIGFKVTDYLIHIEDDIILAPDALQYFEWCRTKYENDKEVFSVDAYNANREKIVDQNPNIVCRNKKFRCWGWATWIDRWESIKERFPFSYGPQYEGGKCVFKGGSWDCAVCDWLRGDRYRVYPLLARSKNIGAKGGAHTPSPEWHYKKHTENYRWAGDINADVRKFEELNEEKLTSV